MKAKDDVTLQANIYVHSCLANSGEYNKSPHFRPENQSKVRAILLRLTGKRANARAGKVVDFGCGTGFMINLMHDLFAEVHGVDITQDMLKQVNLSSGNVYLHESVAEDTPFADGSFDFATAYSFMDHLVSYEAFLREAYRVLAPGGTLYSDLNPNRDFISAIATAERSKDDMSAIVRREITGALHNGEYYREKYGIDGELLEKAEPIKSLDKGFSAEKVLGVAKAIGFSQYRVEYEWFLGQATLLHECPEGESRVVEDYLRSVLPVSCALFKYLRFIFIK